MDRLLRPERFDVEPTAPQAQEKWLHWYETFKNFLSVVTIENVDNKQLLINYISPSVYQMISDKETYEEAIQSLNNIYVQPNNEVFARHKLATCRQEQGQSVDAFLQKLRSLSKDCNFKAVTAEQHRDESIRDAFITGIASNSIRKRLLEKTDLKLKDAFEEARVLEHAYQHSLLYESQSETTSGATTNAVREHPADPVAPQLPDLRASINSTQTRQEVSAISIKCYFCGRGRHPRNECPAREATCNQCGKKGHFQRSCKSRKSTAFALATLHSLGLGKSTSLILLNGVPLKALIDTGSCESYVAARVARNHKWPIKISVDRIFMASTHLSRVTEGHIFATIQLKDEKYENIKLSLLDGLCSDVILGLDFISLHENLQIPFSGKRPPLCVSTLRPAKVEAPSLFGNLSPNCTPVATKSRRHSLLDSKFINTEIQRLLKEEVIEPSKSPWRAQVLITSNERHKRRMVIDYSQTINRFTLLDAYPMPRMDELAEKISQFSVFSTLDLKNAYHQIPIKEEERPYTAFEAGGRLYQFRRIPFGVTNGVACFQRTIDKIIEDEQLENTFAYVDNVTICGHDTESHDRNLQRFFKVAQKYGITFNEAKSEIGTHSVRLLGYEISKGQLKPDPERFTALRELNAPSNLLAYYSLWIPNFSDKISLLARNKRFPVPEEVKQAFQNLKDELEESAVYTIDYTRPLTVETDASDIAIAATLNQDGRPVAFFSRTLSQSERRHSSVEKEAYAIVESLRKWKHFLIGRPFTLVTDQRSVSFMYCRQNKGKIKNEKIQRWRLELSCFHYDVVYRPGTQNTAADTFSRNRYLSAMSRNDLKLLHNSLCHPGVTRMLHFVRSKNLPFSTDDVRTVIDQCQSCAELKPRFFRPPIGQLIKATQPFERISMDFKGPLPSNSRNKYLLTMIDEFSRFPFAFACPDMSSATVIKCLNELFALFGLPSYVHTDRGTSFMSAEVQKYLNERGVATSRTTAYNPRGNGQIEKLNSTLWKAITLALHSQDLSTSQWELVLQDALHSIRSLLCTATNKTPHERLFGYYRRSTSGTSLPTWLTSPGPVLLKRNNRSSKYDPLTEEVELVNSNPQYALIKTSTGREETVSLRLLAPKEKDCFTENVRPPVLRDGSPRNATPSLQSETESNTENSSLNPSVNRTTKPPLSGEVDPVEAPTIESPSNVVSTDTDCSNTADPNCRYNLRERKSRPNYRV
ncbi:uncharacterized protein LOC106074444 [Biomphalaria glabrata]|uniref:RNA-directed DNA polymerase n=1 Tax=Biomphalaria glabrata TaxID=6526 RepID=A0A9W2YI16_BIOGL|nr:uncharacterized protein LOC106074444 [Biomphalaria glabrata]